MDLSQFTLLMQSCSSEISFTSPSEKNWRQNGRGGGSVGMAEMTSSKDTRALPYLKPCWEYKPLYFLCVRTWATEKQVEIYWIYQHKLVDWGAVEDAGKKPAVPLFVRNVISDRCCWNLVHWVQFPDIFPRQQQEAAAYKTQYGQKDLDQMQILP